MACLRFTTRGKPPPTHGDGSNVRSYLYCEDVAEAFEVIFHRGEIGQFIILNNERRVIDVARISVGLSHRYKAIRYVENRSYNDQRYFLDGQKLKNLRWSERLKMTMEWYICNSDWLAGRCFRSITTSRMLRMPVMFDGSEENKSPMVSQSMDTSSSTYNSMLVPTLRSSVCPRKQLHVKFLVYGRTRWIGGLLGKLCKKQGI